VKWTPPPVNTEGWPDPQTPDISVIDLDADSPEDVVVDAVGRVWTGAIGGAIFAIEPDGGHWRQVASTGGRPLGLEVLGETLLICDSERGLLQMEMATGQIEVVVDRIDDVPLTFCSNVIVTEHTGGARPRPLELYLTQSTTRFGYDHYKADIFEHVAAGRLIRVAFDDNGGRTVRAEVVLEDLQFANGVVAHQGRLLVAETGGYCVRAYDPHTRSSQQLLGGLPGYPDNSSLSPDGEHLWLAMAGLRSGPLEALAPYPRVRNFLWQFPERLFPEPIAPLWILKIHLPSGRVVADLRADVPGLGQSTGVVERDGRVWVSGIGSSKIAWFDVG
jgi:sugar lactone lactonase YvrE